MKKIMLLLVLVSVASMASAGLQAISVTGPTTIDDAGVLTTTINIIAGPAGYGAFQEQDWVIGVSSAGALSDALVSSVAGAAIVNNGDATFFGQPGGFWGASFASAAGLLNAGDVLVSFTLTGVAEGVAQVTLYNLTAGMEVEDSASINVTPEPMTMALLGLGGLFLRRRK